MKLTVTTTEHNPSIQLNWQLPGTEYPRSLYILPGELTPKQWPHLVMDLARTAVFWGDKLVHYDSPQSCDPRHHRTTVAADVIYCDTFKLLNILRTLHDRQVRRAEIETDRLNTVAPPPVFTIGELAKHPNLADRDRLGRTLNRFRKALQGGERTFAQLMRDLSRLITSAKLFPNDDEFYFDGRRLENGCGFNGGVILHGNSYGIHT
jgi:hypothetical protein